MMTLYTENKANKHHSGYQITQQDAILIQFSDLKMTFDLSP